MKKIISCCILYFMFDNLLLADFLPEANVAMQEQYALGYNVPPLLFLNKEEDRKYDVSFELSLLSYYASQDGLDLANSQAVLTTGASTGTVVATDNSISLMQDFSYNPGFKAGIGASCNEWTLHADYTRLAQTTITNQMPIDPIPASGQAVWLLNNWFQQVSSFGQTMSATNISSQWNLGLNFADLTMGCPFYEGRYLSIVPFFGVRGAWINQQLNIAINVPSVVVTDLVVSPITSFNSSNSWAVGPRTGCDVSWIFNHGLRIEAGTAANLLFTQYTTVQHSEQVATDASSQLSMQLPNINCVRPQLDMSLGLGWGTYLQDKKYYVDFSIRYDFLLLFQQNMMRKLADQMISAIGAAPGDLYVQGVNIRASFDF